MEQVEIEHIRKYLEGLVKMTDCNNDLLTGLHVKKVLSMEDIDNIQKQTSRSAKASELYRILASRTNAYRALIKTFKKTYQSGPRQILKSLDTRKRKMELNTNEVPRKARKISETEYRLLFNVHSPCELFTGRKIAIQNLHSFIQTSSEVHRLTTVTGLGGMGKTELVRQYLSLHRSLYNHILWIEAETMESTMASLRRLCSDKLDICTKNSNQEEKGMSSLLEEILEILKNKRMLIILNNAEEGEHTSKFIQQVRSLQDESTETRTRLLLTSRTANWGSEQTIKLDEMSNDEAIKFARKGLKIGEHDLDKEIKALVDKLQRFPLAIQQAISCINYESKSRQYGLQDYLEEFDTKANQLLKVPVSEHNFFNEYEKTTLTTWEVTLSKIASLNDEGTLALRILNVMAYLSSDNIERSIFLELAESETLLREAVRILINYSMINSENHQTKLSVHRLVQVVCRLKLQESPNDEAAVLKHAFVLVSDMHHSKLDHAMSVWSHAVRYPEFVKQYSHIPLKISQDLSGEFRLAEAYTFGLAAEGDLSRVFKKLNENVLWVNFVTTDALYRHGKYAEVIKRCNAIISKITSESSRSPRVDLASYLTAFYTRKGEALTDLQKFDEAIETLHSVVETRKQLFGRNRKTTKIAQIIYAGALTQEGKEEERKILEILETALRDFKPTNADDWYYFLKGHLYIGSIHSLGGNFVLAEKKCQFVYDHRKNKSFEKHPHVHMAGYNLAMIYNKLGKSQEALKILLDVSQRQKMVLGESHKDTLITMQGIACALSEQGSFSESLRLHKCTHKQFCSQFQKNCSFAIFSRFNIGMNLFYLGNHDDAREMLEYPVNQIAMDYGESHSKVVRMRGLLNEVYANRSDICLTMQAFKALSNEIRHCWRMP